MKDSLNAFFYAEILNISSLDTGFFPLPFYETFDTDLYETKLLYNFYAIFKCFTEFSYYKIKN